MTQSTKKQHKKSLFDKPFALAIGPQRAGTSWLDRYLRTRGDICVPENVKEIFFFDRHYERGESFYTSHFKSKPHHKTIIEITTTSFDHEDAPQNVLKTCGSDVKLLCPLRNPIIRSYSLYLHYKRYGIVFGSLQDACDQSPQILTSSHYATHLKRWFDAFGQKNIQILFQEDLEKEQECYIKNVCNGLGVPYKKTPKEISDRFNATTYSKSGKVAMMVQNTADWLRKYKLYPIINGAKALGLKPLIFGKENPDASSTDIPKDDKAWLQAQLGSQIEELEAMIGPIQQWK